MRQQGRFFLAVALLMVLVSISDASPVREEASELEDLQATPSLQRQESPLMAAMAAPALPDTPGDASYVGRAKRTLFKKRLYGNSCGGGCCGGCSVCGGCGGGGGGRSYSSSGSYSYSHSSGYGR